MYMSLYIVCYIASVLNWVSNVVVHNWDWQQDFCLLERELPFLGRKGGSGPCGPHTIIGKTQRGGCGHVPDPFWVRQMTWSMPSKHQTQKNKRERWMCLHSYTFPLFEEEMKMVRSLPHHPQTRAIMQGIMLQTLFLLREKELLLLGRKGGLIHVGSTLLSGKNPKG